MKNSSTSSSHNNNNINNIKQSQHERSLGKHHHANYMIMLCHNITAQGRRSDCL